MENSISVVEASLFTSIFSSLIFPINNFFTKSFFPKTPKACSIASNTYKFTSFFLKKKNLGKKFFFFFFNRAHLLAFRVAFVYFLPSGKVHLLIAEDPLRFFLIKKVCQIIFAIQTKLRKKLRKKIFF